jgi:acyl-CoA synthetase (AMP-forming)/AMP-acid ligase II
MLPLDWRWTGAERSAVLRHFGAKHLIVEEGLDTPDVPCTTLARLLSEESRHDEIAVPPTTLESPLLISLSSGTTGRPKGPMIAHRHFLRRFWTHWINLGLNANSRFVSATPLYFGGGRTFAMSTLYSGGTVILRPPPFEPEELAETVERENADGLFLVPTQLRRLLAAPAETRKKFAPLRLLLSSGSPLHAGERHEIRSSLCSQFYEYYASTEGGGISLCTPQDFDRLLTSVGRPIYGVDVDVVDERDRQLPPGHVGHFRYRGPAVADGFYRDPERTSEHFRDGWFYPGDLAERDAAGYVYLRGRSKDTVIRGGINIYPREIEDVLMGQPGLQDCCVIGVPDAEMGECLACAFVAGADLSDANLIAACMARLARYKVPTHWRRVPELPRNTSGKIVKSAIRAMFETLTGDA